MALKFKEKLKGIDLCKEKESLSDYRFGYSDDALALTTV